MYIDSFFELQRKNLETIFNNDLPKPFRVGVALKIINLNGREMPKFTPFAYSQN